MSIRACSEERSPLFKLAPQWIWPAVFVLVLPFTAQAVNAPSNERSGKEVVAKVCSTCHGTGANGAPKIGDKEAWSKRASQGLTSLTRNALTGIRQMPAHGGQPDLTDLEIGRAITYMVNSSGGHWVEPVGAKDMAIERRGEQVVEAQCAKCHQNGLGGAPKIGDRDAWVGRMKQGLDYLVHSAIRGHGGMPARGGLANLTDAEIQNAIIYMFNPAAAPVHDSRNANNAAAKPAVAGSNRMTVGGMVIDLGVVSAQRLRAYPEGSPERSMHGGVPRGADYYHVNVSLSDRRTHAPLTDAHVDIQVEQIGLSSESQSLELMRSGTASYGNYVRMQRNTPYVITVQVQSPGAAPTNARFEYRPD